MKVFIHLSGPGDPPGPVEEREVPQIPAVGEYLALDTTDPWHRVVLVVHTPFDDAQCAAEVYAIRVDHLEVLNQVFPTAER